MHFVLTIMVLYILFSEWRIFDLKKKFCSVELLADKINTDGSLWYSGVLPQSEELCLFLDDKGHYCVTTLNDKKWLKKDGSLDFNKIKKWAYVKDLEKI